MTAAPLPEELEPCPMCGEPNVVPEKGQWECPMCGADWRDEEGESTQ